MPYNGGLKAAVVASGVVVLLGNVTANCQTPYNGVEISREKCSEVEISREKWSEV